MKLNRMDHISIAVKSLDEARRTWEPLLGKSEPDDQYVDESERIRVARYRIGEVGFELMESTASDGPVAARIRKNGEGVMVVSFNVDNTHEAVEELKSKDYRFIADQNGKTCRSFSDCEFAFIHPGTLNGVLTELIDCK